MIRAFRDPETERVFLGARSRRFPPEIQPVALRKLIMIHRSRSLEDLRVPPANRLEKLAGNRKGQYSVRINDQWRICFQFRDGDAWDVAIVDYHT
jgi:proteic killer suppression protein